MAVMYDSERKLNAQLDRLLPLRQFDGRQRLSDPWFDKECRAAKRSTRRLERAFSAVSRRAVVATTFADADAADAVAEADAAKTARSAPFLSSVATQQVCRVLARQGGSQPI